MYTQNIADILFLALLSYHSNKSQTILSKNDYLKNFIASKANQDSTDCITRDFLKGFLKKTEMQLDYLDYEQIFEGLYNDIYKLVKYLENPKISKRSLKDRVEFLAKRLKKFDFVNLVNFDSSKRPFPEADKVIYLDSELYKDFQKDGSLPKNCEIIIRFKSSDLNIIREQALKSGLLLDWRASNHLGNIHDFILYPDNNPPKYISYSSFIKDA